MAFCSLDIWPKAYLRTVKEAFGEILPKPAKSKFSAGLTRRDKAPYTNLLRWQACEPPLGGEIGLRSPQPS